MQIVRAAEGETTDRSAAEIFEGGAVRGRSLLGDEGSANFNASVVHFAAGARARMHRHSGDQLLHVVSGIGKVGDGEGEHVISAGDTVLIPANTEHWHGAHDTGSPMSHITITVTGSETTIA